jgi:hypothetical protein
MVVMMLPSKVCVSGLDFSAAKVGLGIFGGRIGLLGIFFRFFIADF